ncbi:hypothetical protein BS50DRAFT_636338 [Corynespora cassiicola Philippines]|uniref:Uncharacterized protein n=1 Tax=Corynespora cassiicola Philippines TaxID=1448308 RepID=A0A2T2NJQ9_CORCC|nr:hypothetical protein BS50DRAFT_636338 [Corynespora cassiicola Philippines]
MRFTFILASLAATAIAAPKPSPEMSESEAISIAQACSNPDSYNTCRTNCSPLAPAYACVINCLIAYCS